jgi:hypothetical protein
MVLGLAACNAIAGLDGDFGVGEGVAPDDPGSSSGSESSSSSSGKTKPTSSSSTSSSGSNGADGGDGGETGAGTFCDGHKGATVLFCADFTNSDGTAPFGWTGLDRVPDDGTSSLELLGAAGTAERRLHVKAPAGPSGSGVALLQDFAGASLGDGQTLKLEYDYVILSNDIYAFMAGFQLGPAGNRLEYGVAINTCKTDKICGQEPDRDDLVRADTPITITPNAVRHATISLTRNGAQIGATILLGSVQLVTRTSGAEPDGLTGPIRLVAGADFTGDVGTAADVTIDNVLVTLGP